MRVSARTSRAPRLSRRLRTWGVLPQRQGGTAKTEGAGGPADCISCPAAASKKQNSELDPHPHSRPLEPGKALTRRLLQTPLPVKHSHPTQSSQPPGPGRPPPGLVLPGEDPWPREAGRAQHPRGSYLPEAPTQDGGWGTVVRQRDQLGCGARVPGLRGALELRAAPALPLRTQPGDRPHPTSGCALRLRLFLSLPGFPPSCWPLLLPSPSPTPFLPTLSPAPHSYRRESPKQPS